MAGRNGAGMRDTYFQSASRAMKAMLEDVARRIWEELRLWTL